MFFGVITQNVDDGYEEVKDGGHFTLDFIVLSIIIM